MDQIIIYKDIWYAFLKKLNLFDYKTGKPTTNCSTFSKKVCKQLVDDYMCEPDKDKIEIFVDVDMYGDKLKARNPNYVFCDDVTGQFFVTRKGLDMIQKLIIDSSEMNYSQNSDDEQDTSVVTGVYTLKEWLNEFRVRISDDDVKKYEKLLEDDSKLYYFVKKGITNKTIIALHNKVMDNTGKEYSFLRNVFLKNEFNQDMFSECNGAFVVKIKVLERIGKNEKTLLIPTKLQCDCGFCDKTVIINTWQKHTKNSHGHICAASGNDKVVSLDKEGWKPYQILYLNLYSVSFIDPNTNEVFKSMVVGSYNDLEIDSFYEAEIIKVPLAYIDGENSKRTMSNSLLTIMFGVYKIDDGIKLKESMCVPATQKFLDSINMKPHRLIDVMYSSLKIWDEYCNIKLRPNLLMLICTFIGLSRLCFNRRYFNVDVVGTGSIGKTYAFKTIMPLLYNTDYFTGMTPTEPALFGGMSDTALNENAKIKVFVPGIISKDAIVCFDEADKHYSDLNMQRLRKGTYEDTSQRAIIGGMMVKNLASFMYFSNDDVRGKITPYIEDICRVYIGLLKKEGNHLSYFKKHNISLEDVSKKSVIMYLKNKRMFFPEEYYEDDPLLLKSIKTINDQYWAQGDWCQRGGFVNSKYEFFQLPSAMRDFFNIYVHGVSKYKKDGLISVEKNKRTENYYKLLPISAFRKWLLNTIGTIGEDKLLNNKPLDNSLKEFYIKNPAISKKYGRGMEVNDKFSQNISEMITILQLINDPNAKELDESTKHLALVMCMMNWTGLSVDEFNLKKIRTTMKFYDDIDFDSTLAEVDAVEEEEIKALAVKEKMASQLFDLDGTKEVKM